MSLIGHILPPFPSTSKLSSTTKTSLCLQIPEATLQNPNPKPIFLSKLLSLALAATLSSPLPALAIPSLNSQSSLLPPTTPFSQSKNLELGLENGKIRPCPSTNPGCVSTNPKSSSFAFPLRIPENSSDNAIQKLQEAILKTQKNAKIQVVEDTPNGQYLQAEIDGGFGRDVLEFLVKGDVVVYRAMATKVTYVYPFTTAFGDSKGQEERMKKIIDQLGWYAPSFDSMD
ncbi:thylakoid lumenal 17.9 kDa protein, chloroplastic [Alnus glutinosa]|uniref:thylakoid lumenal 17.9 kDa protein, chloroplastic n=1 Tax=Alnus glutinosa TaxID=3517 RepID=UPI002D7A3C9B|nr:thylakoid lumenal 17.9 kDa protein, chloroplastic [Alnus glutinosa]